MYVCVCVLPNLLSPILPARILPLYIVCISISAYQYITISTASWQYLKILIYSLCY